MSSLVARYGTPGAVNGEVFNALGAKIRGKSKLPTGRRTILLLAAPGRRRHLDGRHPAQARPERERDDRGVHDERQHRRLRSRRAALRRLSASARARPRRSAARDVETLADRVYEFLEHKQPGDVDIPEVQDIKRIIRESEAVSGIEMIGLNRDARAFPQSALLPDRQGEEGPDRPRGREDRARAARGVPARDRLRGGRPLRSARHAPDVQGGDRQGAGREHCAARPRCGSTAARGRSGPITEADVARAAVAGRAARQDPGDLQAPVAEGLARPSPARTIASSGSASKSRNKDTAALLDRLGLAEYFAMEAYVVE